jgi:hypothetical protein
MNETISFTNKPYLIAGVQAVISSAKDLYVFQSRGINKLEKSTFHKINQIGGITISFTRDFTTVAKAQPKMNHTAISTTFHVIRNFLKSFNIKN